MSNIDKEMHYSAFMHKKSLKHTINPHKYMVITIDSFDKCKENNRALNDYPA